MGKYLEIPYSYLSMTRHSNYVGAHHHPDQEGTTTTVRQVGRKYLFVYPFIKTHAWYQLLSEERQRMMTDRFRIGHKYPTVKITTTYSYGLDDQEFVLGFETNSPKDFLEQKAAMVWTTTGMGTACPKMRACCCDSSLESTVLSSRLPGAPHQ